MKRLCKKGKIPTHQEASEIHRQLSTNPEVCENCKINPCIYMQYVFGPIRGTQTKTLRRA